MNPIKRLGPSQCVLALACGLLCAETVYGVQGTQFVAPPKYNLVDRFSVNHFSGEVAINVDTVAVGGERGLSHAVTARTNLFEYPANRGFTDKFAAALRYKKIGENIDLKKNDQRSLIWVMSATALGESADFLVMRNGDYASEGRDFTSNFYYEAIGDTRHTLKVEGNQRIWTQPDGTRVYFGLSTGGAGYGSSASRIVRPNGFTIDLHYGTGVTTNTGYQLKFDYVDDDPGLAPEKQGVAFNPDYTVVPTVEQSNQAQWWRKNPKHIYGINRAVEYCDESTIEPCELGHDWPKATFHWPGGMPRAIFIDETVVTVENAKGQKTRLHYEAFDAARADVDDPDSIIDTESAGMHIAPRLVAYTPPGAGEPTVRYTYENQIGFSDTGHGTSPRLITRAGEIKTATGSMGAADYSHDTGQGGEIYRTGGDVKAVVSAAMPGTLQEVDVYGEYRIPQFENSYRNFPLVVSNSSGPAKRYEYGTRGNVKRVELPEIDGQQIVYKAGYPDSCANPKTCNKPLWVEDARGHRTDYSYHSESGQIATVTGPADANGVRPQTRYQYARYYAYYKKDGQETKKADTPLWLLEREAYCRTSAAAGEGCTAGSLDEVVTEYDYGPQDGTPNNLHLRGVSVTAANADGELETRTSCYEYDIHGQRIGETSPKGVPAGGCP